MAITQRRARTILTDWRIWGLTCLLIGWPAIGILAKSNFVLESVTPIVYVYLLILHAIVQDFPGFHLFWAGFTLFCISISTILVSIFDWVRLQRTASNQPERDSITKE